VKDKLRRAMVNYWKARVPGDSLVHFIGKREQRSMQLRSYPTLHGEVLEMSIVPNAQHVPDDQYCPDCLTVLDKITPESIRDHDVVEVHLPTPYL
jgi:hypothetical protein